MLFVCEAISVFALFSACTNCAILALVICKYDGIITLFAVIIYASILFVCALSFVFVVVFA